MKNIVDLLQNSNAAVVSKVLAKLIDDHAVERNRLISLHDRYTCKPAGTPIKTRKMPQENKINNKLNNSFFSMIVDTKTGYFAGNGFTYQIDEANYEEDSPLCTMHNEMLQAFLRRASSRSIDAEIATMASVCGYGVRLLYINREGKETAINVNPWEVIFVTDDNAHDAVAIRYYKTMTMVDDEVIEVYAAEIYNNQTVTFFIEDGEGNYKHDSSEKMNPLTHTFSVMPVIKFKNNPEEMSDGARVFELIDAYDRSMSDLNSEVEQMRLAYMIFKGYEPTKETIDNMKQTGAFGIDGDASVSFLVKDINADAIETHLDRLEKNILRFASSVDLTDESFGSNLSGISIRYKLIGLEQKTVLTQMQFAQAFQRQFKALTTVWGTKGADVDHNCIMVTYDRNLPSNLLEEIDQNVKLKGLVSELTRLGRLPFIQDPAQELLNMEMQTQAIVDTIETTTP